LAKLISNQDELDQFRACWTGDKVLSLVQHSGGFLLANWNVGVGKSYNMDDVTLSATQSDEYDLVICLLPTRKLIEERRPLKNPPEGCRVINVIPRPKSSCGDFRNQQWQVFENNQSGALGRLKICHECPGYDQCAWPHQYGVNFRDASVVYATQAHLQRSPIFIQQVINWTGAKKPLLIFDEANFFMKSFERQLLIKEIARFMDVLEGVTFEGNEALTNLNGAWIEYVNLLLSATTDDLYSTQWNSPFVNPQWAIEVQKLGYRRYRDTFKFIGYDVQQFRYSILESRSKTSAGDIHFSARPRFDCDTIVYSASVNAKFTEYRLDQEFNSPFGEYRFTNADTHWYNIASKTGMLAYFSKNKNQILYFYASLIVKRLNAGKRVLLLSKKAYVNECAGQIQTLLSSMGVTTHKVITDMQGQDLDSDHSLIPLIHYGVIGVNSFEKFDCAFCLNGYYVNEDIINTILQDILPEEDRIPLRIHTEGTPPYRRQIGAQNPDDKVYDVHQVAQMALDYQEMETVIQAVGRVRPFTKPREIITFQCHDNPCMPYTQEFLNFREARAYFEISSSREQAMTNAMTDIKRCKEGSMTQAATATKLSMGLRTVKRYWNL